MDPKSFWLTPSWVEQAGLILASFERWLKRPLLPRTEDPIAQAQALFEAPFVVVSHDTRPDPVFNYGNRQALSLWELSVEEWLALPSRLSAEADRREERAELLRKTAEQGFADDYQGVRISRTGKRFAIHEAIVWNLVDDAGVRRGQAATFARWTPLGGPAG